MLELEFQNAQAHLEAFKPDTDKVEGALVPVAYLHFSSNQDADILAFFEPTLKAFYFDENGPRDLALGLPLRDQHAVFPHARDEEMCGAVLKVEYGLGTMTFVDVILDKFTLSPRDGGRVIVTMRAKVRADEAQAGKLYMLQKQEVRITLEPVDQEDLPEAA